MSGTMKTTNLHLFFIIIILLLQLSAQPNSIDDAPRLISDNGNIIFQTPSSKSISFHTQNGGQIRLNDIDLNALSNEIKQITNNINQINDLKKCNCELINSKLDIYSRKIESLETSLTTSNNKISALENENHQIKEKLTYDDCTNNPCHNGAQCIDGYNSFKCICPANFKGKHCTEDVNECLQISGTIHGCQNGARCENTIGSFRCVCSGKWSGVLCNIPINSCSNASNTDICGHGTCYPDHSQTNPKPFKCLCDSGWSLDPVTKTCIADVDECRVGKYPCSIHPFVACINTPGDVRCEDCPTGFEGNGFTCLDINECANTYTCNLNEECINGFGTYQCKCVQGMKRGTNNLCQPENPCEINNGGCNMNAVCVANNFRIDGRICTCNSGYSGNGVGENGCIIVPTNVTNSGFRRCVRRQLCRNGGTCKKSVTGFTCQCLAGFGGARCRTVINNQCLSNPCLNGGNCEFLYPNHYRCHCQPLFSGVNCENEHIVCGGTYYVSNEYREISLFTSLLQAPTRSLHFPCIWIIISSSDQFLQIIPMTLQLLGDCSEEYVQLQEKSPFEEITHEIGRYCQQSNSTPTRYNTTGSILIIKAALKTNIQQNHGFKIKIIPTNIAIENLNCCHCANGSTEMTHLTNGLFQSLNFPLRYQPNINCAMKFQPEYGTRIRVELQIKTLDLGDLQSNCSDSDYLQINFVEREIKITACNQNMYFNKKFIVNWFMVHFHSDPRSDTDSTRFQLRWKKSISQEPCGAIITMNPTAMIESPALPADIEALCTWKIQQTNSSKLIRLKGTFENWLEGDCSVQLSIFEMTSSGRIKYHFSTCQTQEMLSEDHLQVENDFYILFKKLKGVSTPEFQISAEYACGNSVNMDEISTYEFRSDNYPQNYTENSHCVYQFYAETRKIAISFLDFDINDDSKCEFDYIEISGSNSGYLNKRYCNGNKNELITFNSNDKTKKIIVTFKSNSTISGTGFRAEVSVFDCGGSFFLTNKLIIGYPESHLNESTYDQENLYEMNKVCTWEITTFPDMDIFYVFDQFHLESHPNCDYDYLELVHDNKTKRYCGNNAENGPTATHKLVIRFVSDVSVSGEGFIIRLYVVKRDKYCYESFEASSGLITNSPYQKLSSSYICFYSIKVPQFKKILINITVSGSDGSCYRIPCFGEAKLKIIDGAIGSAFIGDVCPSCPQKEEIKTSSNVASITYTVPKYENAGEFNYTINFSSLDEECGTIHLSEMGHIASPNYPLFAPPNTYCRWEIRSPPGKGILIRISHIRSGSMDETRMCNDKNPVLKIVTAKKEVNIVCSEQITKKLIFNEQSVHVIFQNLANTKYRFRLYYTQVCQFLITSPSGRIESKNGRPPYCLWELSSLRGSKTVIQIVKFDLPPPRNGFCLEFVRISDRENTLLNRSCGNQLLNRTFTSSNYPIKIEHFPDPFTHSNMIGAHEGIVVEYQTQGCIESFYHDPNDSAYFTKTGVIQSAQFPNSVSNIDCLWNFQTVPGYSVKLKFDIIEMESFTNCSEGPILKAWENDIIDEDYVFQACHRIDDRKSIIFQSSTHNVYLKFLSAKDPNGGQRKFQGTYEFVNHSCEYEMSGSEGVIQSPNYPNPYPHNLRCSWKLKVRESMSIHLKILDFETEESLCRYDYVEIFSPINDDLVKLQHLCGKLSNLIQTGFSSLSNEMVIKFQTDVAVSSRGFKAKYFETCGGLRMATASKQFLLSPNYPHFYTLPDGICEWNLVANTSEIGLRIFFYFMGFEGGSNNPNCSSENSLTIIEGIGNNSSIKAVLCSKSPYHPIISNGHYLKVILKSTSGNAIFRAAYGVGSSTCGGDFYLDDGLFTSPFYPNSVNMDIDCVYVIRNSPGSSIDLSIEEFSRENALSYVLHDFVEIRNGPSETSPLLGRFYTLPDIRNYTYTYKFNDSVRIRLRSQGGDYTNHIKFLAKYHINYIDEFHSDYGVLASPQFGHVYNEDTRITWTIYAESSEKLQFTFDQFSVGRRLDNGQCSRGFFLITGSNYDMKEYCGSDVKDSVIFIPPVTVSFSAGGYRYPGFLIRWNPVVDENFKKIGDCEYIIKATNQTQNLTSPNYPNFDITKRFCTWTILTDQTEALDIQMLNFDLEYSDDCKYENFTVRFIGWRISAYLDSDFVVMVKCGSLNNSEFNFFKDFIFNSVKITYKADESDHFPGFKLSYKKACYKELQNPLEGSLQNEEYPNKISENKNCTFILKSLNLNYILNLTALDLPPPTNGKCVNGFLKILTRNINKLLCGSNIPSDLQPVITNSSWIIVNLIVNFSSESRYSGFQIMYSKKDEECGGRHELTRDQDSRTVDMNSNNGGITPHFIECKWHFVSPPGTRMVIDFEDLMIPSVCSESFLAFFDGSTILAPKIGGQNYCTKTNSIFTIGNILTILFKNMDLFSHFRLKVKIGSCGGLLHKKQGFISSPNFPLNYPPISSCIWQISAFQNYIIRLTFMDRDLDDNCSKSNLTVIPADVNENGVIWSNCNSSTWDIYTESRSVRIIFQTNTVITRKGFKLKYFSEYFKCGGEYSDSDSELSSTYYPRTLLWYQRCSWKITVDVSKRIIITIKKLKIKRGCLRIRTARFSYRTVMLYKICDRDLENFEIDTNSSMIEVTGYGVSISFSYSSDQPSICGSNIYPYNNESGIITIENIKIPLCQYVIHNYPEDEGTVSMSLKDHREIACTNVYFVSKIENGLQEPVVDSGSGCVGHNGINVFNTLGKVVNFIFHPGQQLNMSNYKVEIGYKFSRCGGLITESFGYIKSPGYPEKYPNNIDCEWLIVAPQNMYIQLTIQTLHLEHHLDCNYDHLYIRFGEEFDSPSFKKLCGLNPISNETLSFHYNKMRLSFHSDFSLTKNGFVIEYTFINPTDTCNGIIFKPEGSIKSPNYPKPYPSNLRCNWTIHVPQGYHISLTFEPPFDLERTTSNTCHYDSLKIFDSNAVSLLSELCGHIPPSNPINSSLNQMSLVFSTDFNHNLEGFHAKYKSICGGVYDLKQGDIVSAYLSLFMYGSITCEYLIPGWENHLQVVFIYPNFFGCTRFDNQIQIYLEDRNGHYLPGQRICGQNKGKITVMHSKSIKIVYMARNFYLKKYNFQARYFHDENVKVFRNFKRPYGIKTPNFPLPYHHNANLTWIFNSPVGYIFSISLNFVDIEPGNHGCNYDFVSFSTNSSNSSDTIFCGNLTNISPFMVDSNVLIVRFQSDVSHYHNYTGFSASINPTPGPMLGCGGYMNATVGTYGFITSLDLDNNLLYDDNLLCKWQIAAPYGYAVKVTFENNSVSLESRNRLGICRYDHLTIYDGPDSARPMIQQLCGNDQVDAITTQSNAMYLVFYTDFSIHAKGFNLTFTAVPSQNHIVKTVTNVSQTLASPQYPNNSPYDFRFMGELIAVNESDHITITVKDLKVRSSANCSLDQFIIQDVSLKHKNKIQKFCESLLTERVFISSHDKVIIQYQVGPMEITNPVVDRRFQISYELYTCNRTESAYSGKIVNVENFRQKRYSHNLICNLTLIAPAPNLRYQFYFKYLNLEMSSVCAYDYIQFILGEPGEQQYVLPKICGKSIPSSFVTNSSRVSMIFVTDSSVNYEGYDITYVVNRDPSKKCGGEINLDSGVITNPGFGTNYYESGECTWNIKLVSNSYIKWRFTDMQLGNNSSLEPTCYSNVDFVKVSYGNTVSKYCGYILPDEEFQIPVSSFTVDYKSLTGGVGAGFRITWSPD